MDSHVTVNVVEEGSSIPVPNTGSATMGGLSVSDAGIVGVGVIVLSLALIAAIVAVIKKNKQRRIFSDSHSFHINSKKRLIFGMLMLFVLSGAISFNAMKLNDEKVDVSALEFHDIPEGFDNTLAISTSDITMDIELGDKGAFAFLGNDVTVKSPTLAGYKLLMYAEEPDLISSKTEERIKSIAIEDDALGDNNWGFSFDKPTKVDSVDWNGLPDWSEGAAKIKSVDTATEANDTTTLYFGVNLTPDFPKGTYETVITYVAVANFVEPEITFVYMGDDDPLYFDEDKTQEFNAVGYSYVCENEDGSISIGHDREAEENCAWMRVAGKYIDPIIEEDQALYNDGWLLAGVWIPRGEEALLEYLNDGYGEDYYGRWVNVYGQVIDYFTITYDANGGKFIKPCLTEDPFVRAMEDVCQDEEALSVSKIIDLTGYADERYGLRYDGYYYEHTNDSLSIIGWSEDPNAEYATYHDGNPIEIDPTMKGKTITLYAVWGRALAIVNSTQPQQE